MEAQTQNAAPNTRPSHLEPIPRAGKSIQELARELTHIQTTKRDFTVPLEALKAEIVHDHDESGAESPATEKVGLTFTNGEKHDYELNNWSGGQVASFTDIPQAYYRRLSKEAPELLVKNINHGFRRIQKDDETKNRLVRTIDGRVRGFLSNSYRMLDSFDLMEAVMPMLLEHQFQVVSSELTEKRMYLKTATQRIQGEVKVGDVVSYGVMISTSDVGAGCLRVEPYFLRLWCMNGAVSDTKFRKAHLGRGNVEREVQEILTTKTKQLNDQAFFATVRDYVANTMKPEVFQKELDKMKDAANRPINNLDLEQVVEHAMQTVGVTGETVKTGILQALADGNQNAGLTQWGLMNSFTAAAKMTAIDYDTATDLERAGGLILNLNKNQWHHIAEKQH